MIRILIFSLFLSASFAEIICNPNVPYNLIPELASCDYALRQLVTTQQQCGSRNIIFSPSARGAFVHSLPSIFVGAGPDYTPAGDTWCTVLILWQPRPTARPPRVDEDIFPFWKILRAAYGIREQCMVGRPGHLPQIGRTWIKPNEFVDVQIAGVFPSEVGDRVSGDALLEGKNMTLILADGSRLEVSSNSFEGGSGCKSRIAELQNVNLTSSS